MALQQYSSRALEATAKPYPDFGDFEAEKWPYPYAFWRFWGPVGPKRGLHLSGLGYFEAQIWYRV